MRSRKPLGVIVTWNDPVSEPRSSVQWEWSAAGIAKIGADEMSDIVRDRTTRGLLGYIDEELLKLFKDFDSDNALGNSTTIAMSLVTRITTMSGRLLYRRVG